MTYVQKMEDVRKRALKQGIMQGAVSMLKSLGQSKEAAQEALARAHSLSPDEARQEVEKYW